MDSKIYDKKTVFSALAHHVGRAVRKLRDQDAAATSISVTIRTNAFSSVDPQYSNTATAELPIASDDLSEFTRLARTAFDRIWRDGYPYTKTGITINGITPKDQIQNVLFSAPTDGNTESAAIMEAMESINSRYGQGTAIVASQRQGGDWQPRAENKPPQYTTRWSDIPTVKA